MSRRTGRLRRLLLCAVLQLGVFSGVPMRPDEIARLMRSLSQPRLASTNPDESDRGERLDHEPTGAD